MTIVQINQTVLLKIKTCMDRVNKLSFLETKDNLSTIGAETGGFFCFHLTDNLLKLIDFKETPPLPGETSFNTGDYPFTFHTHPVVIKDNTVEKWIDNFPNIMSGEDLIGCVQDNFYYTHSKENRIICGKHQLTNINGINFFDLVAVPCGIYIYRPMDNSNLFNLTVPELEEVGKRLEEWSSQLFPEYKERDKWRYAKKSSTIQRKIKTYISQLQQEGFQVDFYFWEDIEAATNPEFEFYINLTDKAKQGITQFCQCDK